MCVLVSVVGWMERWGRGRATALACLQLQGATGPALTAPCAPPLTPPAAHPSPIFPSADVSFASDELSGRKRKRGEEDESDPEVQLEEFEKREIMRVGAARTALGTGRRTG